MVLHLNKLKFPSPKGRIMISLIEFFFNFFNVFSLFYLSLKMSGILRLNKLESRLPKNALCQVCLKLTKCFSRRKFSKIRQCIFTMSLSSPIGKERDTSFEQNCNFTGVDVYKCVLEAYFKKCTNIFTVFISP